MGVVLTRGLSTFGLTVALVMVWAALSPSLLPRTWWLTALNVGISAAFGYAVGMFLAWVWSRVTRLLGLEVTLRPGAGEWLRRIWVTVLVVGTAWAWRESLRLQAEIARLVDAHHQDQLSQALGILGGIALFLVILIVARLLLLAWRGLTRLFRPVIPRFALSGALATVVLVALVLWSNQALYRQLMEEALSLSVARNATTAEGRTAPVEPERSGSPTSYESWESLGTEGQVVVADGPRAAQIEAVTGSPAMEPIRVYAGKQDGRDLKQTALAVVAELERTGAFDRSVLHLATPTGSGWVQEWALQSVEYLAGGDVASAAMQYSYFPSPLAYVSDRTTPPAGGAALFDAVSERLEQMPEQERPRLVVSGESLGAYGGQGAFDSPEEMLTLVDGAVWTGTPRFTPMWQELTNHRRQGSPEIAPVIDNGAHIRFVTRPAELTHDFFGGPYAQWQEPRVVYVQHASDPVVWWSPDLLVREPDWLAEHVGRDVTPAMSWFTWVTFWQVATDMPLSTSTVGGHGHTYEEELVPVWAAVLGLPEQDWTPIQDAIREHLKPH